MPQGWIFVVAYALAIVFFGLATVALFGTSAKTRAFFEPRVGSAHAAVIRYALLLVGLVVILIITLHLFEVPVSQLLLGTALTSVLIGIAAQQSLSNVFAGMVLLLSRPFRVGDPIQLPCRRARRPAPGRRHRDRHHLHPAGHRYTVLNVPNSQVLAAAVGPIPRHADKPPPVPEVENPATRPPGTGAHA